MAGSTDRMKFGFVVPWADAGEVGELAAAAEGAGWDGLFVWEPVWGVDAWISLALAAARTSRIRLGTMLTPPSRRRPWELASQVATVDRLSGGRVTLSVGLGAIDSGFEAFGEECDRRTRAELMDECLEIVTGLWDGQPFEFHGTHFHVKPTNFPTIGATVQQPRVPIWCVGAIGRRTSTIRLGTMLTPPSRRRPWELASQVATVDRLSAGRVILSVGLGAVDSGFEAFGEECDRRTRAELMDECLEIVTGLWDGQPFEYDGAHFHVKPTDFPTIGNTVQQPRVPIWCVGAIGRRQSMERALRWDGLIPQVVSDGDVRQATLDEVAAVRADVGERPYDIVIEGVGSEHSPAAWHDAGATWWIESMWDAMREDSAATAALDRLREGPLTT